MHNKKHEYRVSRSENRTESFDRERDAFDHVKLEAAKHPTASFSIEKVKIIFDPSIDPEDKKTLHKWRAPARSNAIHVSIHLEDRDIG
jgi:hypothetical protein